MAQKPAGACPSTLVLGAAKSGTTALFYAIREAMMRELGEPLEGSFEPRNAAALANYLDNSKDPTRLCKALLAPMLRGGGVQLIERFDRKIVIYRDPRDNIVSRLLFMPARLFIKLPRELGADFVKIIQQKTESPKSLSITKMIAGLERLTGEQDLLENVRSNALLPAKIMREQGNDNYFMYRYDDMVAGRFDTLSDYLGFPVAADYAVGTQHGYVARGKGSGEWRRWFLDEDLAYFVHEKADDYRLMGFDPTEEPDAEPVIDPATSSRYLEKEIARWRDKRIAAKAASRQRLIAEATPEELLAERKRRREYRRAKA